MNIVTEVVNGKEIRYKLINGTAYHEQTSDEIVRVLEHVRAKGIRIVLDYGDVETGVSWGDTCDIAGRVSRSTGNIKIPILVHNRRSTGGGAVLDHCIIGIRESAGKRVLYSR